LGEYCGGPVVSWEEGVQSEGSLTSVARRGEPYILTQKKKKKTKGLELMQKGVRRRAAAGRKQYVLCSHLRESGDAKRLLGK